MAAPLGNKNGYKHGLTNHPLYRRFVDAKRRCTNKNYHAYKTYKCRWGKNTVIELTLHYMSEWDMRMKDDPNEVWSVDRIDNNGKYEIGNVQIISKSENSVKRNKETPLPDLRVPVEGYINGKWVFFSSQSVAGEKTDAISSKISDCCRG